MNNIIKSNKGIGKIANLESEVTESILFANNGEVINIGVLGRYKTKLPINVYITNEICGIQLVISPDNNKIILLGTDREKFNTQQIDIMILHCILQLYYNKVWEADEYIAYKYGFANMIKLLQVYNENKRIEHLERLLLSSKTKNLPSENAILKEILGDRT